MKALENKIDNLIQSLENFPDIGIIQAGPEYRIVNRSTGEILETCHTEDYAKRVLEQYRERAK
jgi:hypothetical protein